MFFSADLDAKIDENSMFFGVRVFDAARFFFSNPATLDFADRRSTLECFRVYGKYVFHKKCKKTYIKPITGKPPETRAPGITFGTPNR